MVASTGVWKGGSAHAMAQQLQTEGCLQGLRLPVCPSPAKCEEKGQACSNTRFCTCRAALLLPGLSAAAVALLLLLMSSYVETCGEKGKAAEASRQPEVKFMACCLPGTAK